MAKVIVKELVENGQSQLISDNLFINIIKTAHAMLAPVVF